MVDGSAWRRGRVAAARSAAAAIRPATWVAGLLCALALTGWWWGIDFPTRYVPGLPAMTLNGALAFGLLSMAVAATQAGWGGLARGLARTAAALAAVTGVQWLLAVDLGIDALLWWPAVGHGLPPGRMPLAMILALLLLSMHWWPGLAHRTRLTRVAAIGALVIAYVGSIGLMADLHRYAFFAGLSIPTSAVTLLLGLEVYRLHRASQPASAWPAGRLAAPLVRQALPAALLLPVLAGWALTAAPNPRDGTGMVAALALVVTGGLFALAVHRSSLAIDQLDRDLRDERDHLERRVLERTAELRASQEREAAARQQLDLIIDGAGLAVIAARPSGQIVYLNAAAMRLFGLADDAPLPADLSALLPEPQRLLHAGWVQAFAEAGEPARRMGRGRMVSIRRHSDGSDLAVEATIAVTDRDPPLVTVVMQDRTEQTVLEAARRERDSAQASHQAKNDLIARINHDLRTPLNAVLGFAQLLQVDPALAPQTKQRGQLQLIVHAAHSLRLMLQDLSDIARLDSGRLRVVVRRLQVGPACKPVLDWLRLVAEQSALTWPQAVQGGELEVMADPDRFEQILSNLLNNAIKYNRPAGRVDLRCERQGGWVRLHVADTGRGLSAEQQARVFNPWDRVGREDSGIEGSGLGLSIARDLARAMSGDLSVASVVGEGSVFTLTLPAAD